MVDKLMIGDIVFHKHNFLFVFYLLLLSPSNHIRSDHYRPDSETPSEWRFAGGLIVARDGLLAMSSCTPFDEASYNDQKRHRSEALIFLCP